jgi:hypothetical protein
MNCKTLIPSRAEWKLWVKPYISAGGSIIELAMENLRRVRIDLPQKQGFTPTRMADYQVGLKPAILEFARNLSGSETPNHIGLSASANP